MSSEQKKENKTGKIISHPWKTFGFEVGMFVATILLGLLAALRLREIAVIQKIALAPMSLWDFVVPFVVMTAVLISIVYIFKNRKFKAVFFKVFFVLAVAFGALYFFGLWFPGIVVLPLVACMVILLIKRPSVILHNAAMIFAMAGMGSALGMQIAPLSVAVLFLVFAIYDFIAVYKTKHMVKMAEAMIENKSIVGFVIPHKVSDLSANLKGTQIKGRFMVLGGGDVIFPLIFAVSVLQQSILHFFIIAGFSLLGLLAVFLIFISKKTRAPMPALPPIALLSIIGYLLTMII